MGAGGGVEGGVVGAVDLGMGGSLVRKDGGGGGREGGVG